MRTRAEPERPDPLAFDDLACTVWSSPFAARCWPVPCPGLAAILRRLGWRLPPGLSAGRPWLRLHRSPRLRRLWQPGRRAARPRLLTAERQLPWRPAPPLVPWPVGSPEHRRASPAREPACLTTIVILLAPARRQEVEDGAAGRFGTRLLMSDVFDPKCRALFPTDRRFGSTRHEPTVDQAIGEQAQASAAAGPATVPTGCRSDAAASHCDAISGRHRAGPRRGRCAARGCGEKTRAFRFG